MAAFYKESQTRANGNAEHLRCFCNREGNAESDQVRLLKMAEMEKQENQKKWLRIKVIMALLLDGMVSIASLLCPNCCVFRSAHSWSTTSNSLPERFKF